MFPLFLESAWQVVLAALLLGAGLPALFALGVRSFALAGGAASTTGAAAPPRAALRVLGAAAYGLVIAAVLVGLTVIIATGFGKELSFEHIVPVLVDKE